MLDGALVEAVDLELQPVVAEIRDEVALQSVGGIVGDPAAAIGGMDGEPFEMGDPRAAIGELEPHRAGPFSVVLDHKAAEVVRLALRALDLHGDVGAILRRDGTEERFDVLVTDELVEEVHVVRVRSTDRDGHRSERQANHRRA